MRTYTPKPPRSSAPGTSSTPTAWCSGRLATEVARLLRGKHKPIFAPHLDTGDHVIVVNADKVVLTAGKAERKNVYRHSGYPGGLKPRPTPTAGPQARGGRPPHVRGMLPKGRLGRQMLKKLKVYAGPAHPARRPAAAAARARPTPAGPA